MGSALGIQHDGTCPSCGRFAQIECSVHGHLEGDPWAEIERLRGALEEIRQHADGQVTQYARARDAVAQIARAALRPEERR